MIYSIYYNVNISTNSTTNPNDYLFNLRKIKNNRFQD